MKELVELQRIQSTGPRWDELCNTIRTHVQPLSHFSDRELAEVFDMLTCTHHSVVDWSRPSLHGLGEPVKGCKAAAWFKLYTSLLYHSSRPNLPQNSEQGAEWETLSRTSMGPDWQDMASWMKHHHGFHFWSSNASCIPVGTCTKGHNHVPPVVNSIPTGGRKLVFLLPPNLSKGKDRMRNGRVNQHKSLNALLTEVRTYGVRAHVCLLDSDSLLYFPPGYWHWFVTIPARQSPTSLSTTSASTHCICLSAYVMPSGMRDCELVLKMMGEVYHTLEKGQKRSLLESLQAEDSAIDQLLRNVAKKKRADDTGFNLAHQLHDASQQREMLTGGGGRATKQAAPAQHVSSIGRSTQAQQCA